MLKSSERSERSRSRRHGLPTSSRGGTAVHHPSTPVVDQPRCRAHRPPPAPEQSEWLLPGERIHAEITADAWRFLALDVPYDRRTILFGGPFGFLCTGIASMIGNRRARRAAEAVAAPQWRHLGHLPIIVTNRRLLIEHRGAWWPVWLDAVESVDRHDDFVALGFHSDPAYGIRSPIAAEVERLTRIFGSPRNVAESGVRPHEL